MRVTIDLDDNSLIKLFLVIGKGMVALLKYFPRIVPEIERTRKGFHVTWRHLPISEEESFKYRLLIGDDRNRINLDMQSWKRIKQVMFNYKKSDFFAHKKCGSLTVIKEGRIYCPKCKVFVRRSGIFFKQIAFACDGLKVRVER